MRERFARFMMGRNGPDQLTRDASILALVLIFLNLFLSKYTFGILWVLAVLLLAFCYFRMFSRNVYKRREENANYLRKKQKFFNRFRSARDRWSQRKDYCFFKCPSCKHRLRVPRGKGRVRIVCRKCGTAFEKKT